MERRLTAFVLPVLLVTLALVFFSDPPGREQAPPAPETAATPAGESGRAAPPGGSARPRAAAVQSVGKTELQRTFGRLGETGGLHVVFDRRGGSVRSVRLLDEPATPAGRKRGTWGIDESYLLVDTVEGGVTSLQIGEARDRLQVPLGQPWEVQDLSDGVAFSLHDPEAGLTLHRTYRHIPGRRELLLSLSLIADAERPDTDAAKDLPEGADCPLWLYGPSLVNPATGQILGNPAVAIGQMLDESTGQAIVEVQRPDGKPNPTKKPQVAYSARNVFIDFAGTTNRFFGAFLRPHNEAARLRLWRVEMEKLPRSRPLPEHDPFSVPVANYRIEMKVPPPGQREDLEFLLYLGPKSSGVFDEHPDYEPFHAVMDVDLTPVCPCTIPGATQMGKALLWGLRNLHDLVGSWGLAIVLLTLIVRGGLVPLNFRMQKAMRAYGARAARLKPELDALKERYAKEPKKMQQEMVAFQRKHKLFPPLGGCLPLLVTIPVFLGLFTALRVAYELRCQPFIGWIDDLSQPDRLFEIGLAWLPHFNLLPILMVALWLVLQAGTPLPTDPQQRQMMKIMRFMPLLFGVMLYNYAAGLMVYMVTSSMLGIVEQRITKKILGPPPAIGGAAVPTF